MSLSKEQLQAILDQIEVIYPDWRGFEDSRFKENEINYKQATVEKARHLLSADVYQSLLEARKFEVIIETLDKLGKDNNLLWLKVPLEGDLNTLYRPNLNKEAFSNAFYDLLWGTDETPVKLDRYIEFAKKNQLPIKWTFPTYFLFICHPESELYIKPQATRDFLNLIGRDDFLAQQPTGKSYSAILLLAQELLETFKDMGVRGMVDIHSLIWVCHQARAEHQKKLLSPEKCSELEQLIADFQKEYPTTDGYNHHVHFYGVSRKEGKGNFEEILAAKARGEDITDAVLLKLLPYSDNERNLELGAWISIAPAIQGNLKGWFEAAGWTDSSNWPIIAEAIVEFVQRCVVHPEQLDAACRRFAGLAYTKGFQAGFLSPILNALDPDNFVIINNKSRHVVNYFTGNKLNQTLEDYPALNGIELKIIEEFKEFLRLDTSPELTPADTFDMFTHWLVAVKKFPFRNVRYWKIAPGENAWNWDACRENGYIAIGWEEFGDVSKLSRSEFNVRRDELCSKHGWKKSGVDQVWNFAHLTEGDYVIANDGTSVMLGTGVISGPYYFVEGEEHGHRLPVDWFDITRRRVDESGWRRTMVKLDAEKFTKLCQAPSIAEAPLEPNPGASFTPRTFELLSGLHENPTKDFYNANRPDIQHHVEEPLKRLFALIARRLPKAVTEVMETEKRIMARILKNDFGRGGAWDYYWGAFYPKGSYRVEDAQLFIWLNRNILEYGFYIGDYGKPEVERFLRNSKQHKSSLQSIIKGQLDDMRTSAGYRAVYGDAAVGVLKKDPNRIESDGFWESNPTIDTWFDNLNELGRNIALVHTSKTLLQLNADKLADEIATAFETLYPLVILTREDDPLPKIRSYLGEEEESDINEPYTLEQIAAASGFAEELLDRWVRAIERKGQAVFYGPPGTGKTFVARQLARHLIGGGDGFFDLVQFHPAYAYEDFMQGIRPQSTSEGLSYPMVPGRFMEFCNEARRREGICVLVIDEINRANLAKVFGELMYLLEYRNESIPLAGGKAFRIPANVRLIGTMNTADRSIALVDHALRRRFAFLHLEPDYDVLRHFHRRLETGFPLEGLIGVLRKLNREINDRHYEVGITFFLREDLPGQIEDIWRMEIEPYLEEFFFDQPSKVEQFRWTNVADEILR